MRPPSRREAIKLAIGAVASHPELISAGAGAVVILTGCGGGSGGAGSSPQPTIAAPSNLSYTSPAQATVGNPGPSLTPSVSGSVTSYSVSPALPAGITINASTGVISGTPTAAASQTTYTITASNAGGSTTFALTLTVYAGITVSSSTSTPTALTPVALNVTGLDFTSAFTVQLANSSGYSAALNPIRTSASAGVVVIAAPLYIDPGTGTTGPLAASVQITQGNVTSSAVPLAIADLPTVASYGVNPGDISHAFFNAQSIYFGITVNALQAMRALPTSKTDTTTVQAHLTALQLSTIEARSNVDVIVSGSLPSLSVGALSDGSPLVYNAHSVDIQDRIFGMYLQSIGYLPTTIYPPTPTVKVKPYIRKPKHRAKHETISTPAITPKNIIDGLGVIGGAIGLYTNDIQYNTAKNSTDATIAFGQGVSTAALILGTIASAPELVAAATIVGTAYALAGLANDGIKWYNASNAVAAAMDSGNAQALTNAQNELSDAKANVALDAIGSVLGVFGFPQEVANDVGVGAQVVKVLTTAQEGITGGVVQGLGILTNAVGYLVTLNGQEASTDSTAMTNSNLEIPASSTSFGLVDGMVVVLNANGPILSPLSGAYLTEPNTNTAFSTLAGTDNNYSLIVPLGVPGFNYADMSLEPYDPVGNIATGIPTALNLSGLTAQIPLIVPTITGSCTDTDASAPDQDDPDCD